MRLTLDGYDRAGRAIDCRQTTLDPKRVLAAVRDPTDDGVRCPRASPVHDAVGGVGVGTTTSRRQTLAAVARSRGVHVPELDALAEATARLESHTVEPTTLAREREQVAAVRGNRAQLRETVARRRGIVQGRREQTGDASDAIEKYRAAAAELSEQATTERASVERLRRERTRVRDRYDARERRLKLEDAVANHERAARKALATTVEPHVEHAQSKFTDDGLDPTRAFSLAAASVAVLAAPVVVAGGTLDTTTLADRLGAAVIRV